MSRAMRYATNVPTRDEQTARHGDAQHPPDEAEADPVAVRREREEERRDADGERAEERQVAGQERVRDRR